MAEAQGSGDMNAVQNLMTGPHHPAADQADGRQAAAGGATEAGGRAERCKAAAAPPASPPASVLRPGSFVSRTARGAVGMAVASERDVKPTCSACSSRPADSADEARCGVELGDQFEWVDEFTWDAVVTRNAPDRRAAGAGRHQAA